MPLTKQQFDQLGTPQIKVTTQKTQPVAAKQLTTAKPQHYRSQKNTSFQDHQNKTVQSTIPIGNVPQNTALDDFDTLFEVANAHTVNQPYLKNPGYKINYNGSTIYRPNHNSTHSARQARLMQLMLEDPDFITKFSSQQQNILILAAYFCRSGRVDESSHKSQNPDNYYSRSANIFEAYVKQVIPQDVQGKADLVWGKKLIENSCKPSAIWSLNMSKTPGSLDCVGYDLITLAHELDLMRCFGKEFKNKTLPSIQSRAQKLALDPNKYLEKAINLCQITGSRIESDLTVNGQKIKRNFDMRKFSKNSLSGRDCWRTCLQIK